MFTEVHHLASSAPALVAGAGTAAGWLSGQERRRAGRLPETDGSIWPELSGQLGAAAAEASPEPPLPPPPAAPTFTEAEVASLCASAAAEAVTKEAARLRDLDAERRLAADARLAAAFDTLAEAVRSRREELRAGAVAVGAALGRALAHEATLRDPAGAAAAIVAEVVGELRRDGEGPPEIAIEVPETQADELRARLAEGLLRDAGSALQLQVRSSGALRPGEVQVLWRDGWAERLLADLEARAASALAALAGPGAPVDSVEITEGSPE